MSYFPSWRSVPETYKWSVACNGFSCTTNTFSSHEIQKYSLQRTLSFSMSLPELQKKEWKRILEKCKILKLIKMVGVLLFGRNKQVDRGDTRVGPSCKRQTPPGSGAPSRPSTNPGPWLRRRCGRDTCPPCRWSPGGEPGWFPPSRVPILHPH